MKIRPAAKDDLETVRELWEALYRECPEPEHEQKSWTQVAADVRVAIDDHIVLLAENDGNAVGFLLARPKGDRIGYVSDLYVRPAHRKRRVASSLLREATRVLARPVVTLDVGVANEGARTFYRRLGFHEQSRRMAIESERLA